MNLVDCHAANIPIEMSLYRHDDRMITPIGLNLSIGPHRGAKLAIKNRHPVFVTRGSKGQIVFEGDKATLVPAVPAEGPLDICGAGDAAISGIVSALCCGASCCDAALLGNMVASITIRQLGTTGTASPRQLLSLGSRLGAGFCVSSSFCPSNTC